MVGFPPPVSKPYHNWAAGMEKHGDEYIAVESLTDPMVKECETFYQTNELKPKFMHGERMDRHGKYMLHILESRKPFIVSESAPFRHYPEYLRFGWWSYKWDLGNFNNDNVDRNRWLKFAKNTDIQFKDWRKNPDGKIVIMGQKEGDSSLRRMYNDGYESFYFWVVDQVREIRKYTDRDIVIRPHPRNLERGIRYTRKALNKLDLEGVDTSNILVSDNLTAGGNQGGEGLQADLDDAYCVVTYNSLSGVEAVMEGIPVFAMDGGSMVAPIAHTDYSEIEDLHYDVDLTEWQNKIAYTMWNKEEVQSGECWAHLKSAYFK